MDDNEGGPGEKEEKEEEKGTSLARTYASSRRRRRRRREPFLSKALAKSALLLLLSFLHSLRCVPSPLSSPAAAASLTPSTLVRSPSSSVLFRQEEDFQQLKKEVFLIKEFFCFK